MRVSDFIADYIYKLGVKHVFMVSGGGMMFLSDGIAMHPHIEAVCHHHEQAAAMAAVSYAKYKQGVGVCYVTTGCGGTNAVTGLLQSWQDNIPCIFISGQAKRKETIRNSGLKLRQFGVQEADIISIVQSITKYSEMVNKPELIAYHLEKAVYIATNGRPGPVWLDIPLDVQAAKIDGKNLLHFSNEKCFYNNKEIPTEEEIKEVYRFTGEAKRPIIIAGHGIRLAKAIPDFKAFVEGFHLPFVVTKLSVDLLPNTHPLYVGRIGNKGDRPGNMALQNSDMVLSIGCRLSVSTTGHEYSFFAREAKVIVLDIDPAEHLKQTVRIDKFIHGDAKVFLKKINEYSSAGTNDDWVETCQHWKQKYPVCLPEYAEQKNINLYYLVDCLSKSLKDDSVVVSDAGAVSYAVHQGLMLSENQRFITSGGQGEMGYALPATIGISFAKNKGEVIAVTGDGSFQMNLQELQTIIHNNLPIKIFVCNNNGYMSIRATQNKFFEGRIIGANSLSGVSFPSLEKLAYAYEIKYFKIDNSQNLLEDIKKVLSYPQAVLCEVICMRDQEIIPSVASYKKEDGTMVSRPLEDMYPFLDREEFKREMIVKPLPE